MLKGGIKTHMCVCVCVCVYIYIYIMNIWDNVDKKYGWKIQTKLLKMTIDLYNIF